MVLPSDYLNSNSASSTSVSVAPQATATSMTDPDSYFNDDMD